MKEHKELWLYIKPGQPALSSCHTAAVKMILRKKKRVVCSQCGERCGILFPIEDNHPKTEGVLYKWTQMSNTIPVGTPIFYDIPSDFKTKKPWWKFWR
jgi:hypothetical protein